jgi:transcriptional regulator with XRE-family HTH domain
MKKGLSVILKELRKEYGLTQQAIADIINLSQRAYAHYEKGEQEPNIETLIKLADYYKLPLDILVGRDMSVFLKKMRAVNDV